MEIYFNYIRNQGQKVKLIGVSDYSQYDVRN